MITPLAMDRSAVFRSIYCPHTLGKCPLHRWQMNCLACDRYSRVRRIVFGDLHETVPAANRLILFYETVSSPEIRAMFGPKKPDL